MDELQLSDGINNETSENSLKNLKKELLEILDKELEQECKDERGEKKKRKMKKVSFLDEFGFQIAEVFVVPSSIEPVQSADDEKHLNEESSAILDPFFNTQLPKQKSSWMFTFQQPMHNVGKLKKRLQCQKVALESVTVRNDIQRLYGTVKIQRPCTDAQVFIRCTDNNWMNFKDHNAVLLNRGNDMVDTYFFDFKIPPNDINYKQIQFCVGCKLFDQLFWDDNDQRYYKLLA
ncbi:Protein phosphatase 1 regulatory subunit 3C [Trichinella patagoniensis]|uniref:Protein phosphatase 1 regulatory subunit 3C n=1 Tax=Trichinella patagoniensis TaxID=990121 RepID=A0A0V0ZY76_9BILA|nr:Protein phosphatase 1 regulatory subunit 3C [Trichinella patagoniensis]